MDFWTERSEETKSFSRNREGRKLEQKKFAMWSDEKKAAAQRDLSSVGKMYGLHPGVGEVEKAARSQAAAPETKAPQSTVQKPYAPTGQAAKLGETNAPEIFTFLDSPKAEIPANRFSGEGTALPGWQAKTGMVPIPKSVDISSENLLAATPLGAYTNIWNNEGAGAPAASVFADMDDETLSRLITAYSDQMQKLKSAGPQESGEKSYGERTWNQIALGNYSDDATLLGTAAQVGMGLLNLDLPMDIRDLTYDITNWEWTPEHIAQTLLDTVGFIPVIGSLKYADEFADVLKSADELADLVKRAPELVDAARAVGKLDDVLGSVDEFGELLESAPEVADLFKNTDEAVDLLGSADEIFKGARDVSIYRAVGPEEFYDIFENKQFRTTDTSLYAKQFGFDFDDTLKYANWSPDAAAIIEVKIPDSVLKDIGDFTPLDTPIFKHGTVTIHGDQLDIFNKYISDIFHVF